MGRFDYNPGQSQEQAPSAALPRPESSGYEVIPTQLPTDKGDISKDNTTYNSNLNLVRLYNEAKLSVVRVDAFIPNTDSKKAAKVVPATGSGFFVTPDQLVTNYHVIKDTPEGLLTITTADGRKVPVEVTATEPANDLALLRVKNGQTFRPMRLQETSDLKPNEALVALGYPHGLPRVYLSLGGNFVPPDYYSGRPVSKLFVSQDGSSFKPGGFDRKMPFSALIYDAQGRERVKGGLLPGENPHRTVINARIGIKPGNSGGPLLNGRFEVVGVVGSNSPVYETAQSTPAEDLNNFLRRNGVSTQQTYELAGQRYVTKAPDSMANQFPFLRQRPQSDSQAAVQTPVPTYNQLYGQGRQSSMDVPPATTTSAGTDFGAKLRARLTGKSI